MSASAKQLAVLAIVYASCLVILFYPGLARSQVPAFRDAYHFYYPQAVWLDQCAKRGETFPQWDNRLGWGTSCPGQTSYALYYPLRLIWLIPGLSVAQRYSFYVVAHLLIAAIGAACAAHKLALSREAQCLAAISYSLSCPVLFQHNNLIYLASAAWIGFALAALIDLFRGRNHWRSSLSFSTAVAMMLLGGDPHTAANSFIVAVGVCFVVLARSVAPRLGGTKQPVQPIRTALHLGMWMTVVLFLVAGSTAIQWIPTLRQSLLSERASTVGLPFSLASDESENHVANETQANSAVLQRIASVETKSSNIYDFSLSPWHLATTLWPVLGGHYLPEHSRWFTLLPAEGRMWIPSLYFGWLPCLFMLSGITRRASPRVRWLLLLALFTLLAALGNYSVTWLLHEFTNAIGLTQIAEGLPASHVGSVYWVLTQVFHGYAAFRYPAKWTVWFVAACSLAAAARYDESRTNEHTSTIIPIRLHGLLVFGSLSIVCGGVALWLATLWNPEAICEWLNRLSDRWLGAPQSTAMAKTLLISGSLPLIVLFIISGSKFRLTRWTKRLSADERVPEITLILTIVEMACVAAFSMSFVEPPNALDLRVGLPLDSQVHVWADSSEADIMHDRQPNESGTHSVEQALYQNLFLLGRLASIPDLGNLAATQSITAAPLARLKRWLARRDTCTSDQPELDAVLAQLGVTHRLVRATVHDAPTPFAWQAVPKPAPMCELFAANDADIGSSGAAGIAVDTTGFHWQWTSSSRLTVDLNQTAPAVLLIRQFNDGGWQSIVETRGGERSEADLPRSPGPFIVITLPSGATSVTLVRKWLW